MQNSDPIKVNIKKRLPESNHFNSRWVRDRYDLDIDKFEKSWSFQFTLPEKWNIGLIVGNSGSGKSVVSRDIFDKVYQGEIIKEYGVPLVEAMGESSMEDIVNALTHVGMGSAPE